jgi:hypothetical protein
MAASRHQPEGGKHGAVFAVQVQVLLRAGEIAVQAALRPVLIPGAETWPKALVQRWLNSRSRSQVMNPGTEAFLRADERIRV